MSKDFLYLKSWIGHRPVILECIRSRSGMSMGVYDRGERIFTVNGCGFDRIGTALGEFLEACFMPELRAWAASLSPADVLYEGNGRFRSPYFHGARWNENCEVVRLFGETGFASMQKVAAAIDLEVTRSESKAGTLILIQKKGA